MKRVHIVGRKNSGKTTLIVDLVAYLTRQGYRVGTIKHTHHHHELDTPGKDSHRHRVAGAEVVGILSPGMTAVFQSARGGSTRGESRYELMASTFVSCDLVLVEGDLKATAPKVEVWRAVLDRTPIAVNDQSIVALVSDDGATVGVPVWKRSELDLVADRILQIVHPSDRS